MRALEFGDEMKVFSPPRLADLPPPPPGKTGWPWTEERPPLPERMPDGSEWPRISIVTPSLHQVAFIEETIRSVLLQGYPNLEYIIIDGASTDGTVDIIRKYEPWTAYCMSEKDRGQGNAINKGLKWASGEIIAYINSDDFYLPGAFHCVAQYFVAHVDVDLMHGRCRYIDESGNKLRDHASNITKYAEILDLWDVWWNKRQFVQPEVFWTKRITDKVGPFRENLHWVMDYEFWARILRAGGKVGCFDAPVGCFRFHANQKSTQPKKTAEELLQVVRPLIWEKRSLLSRRQRLRLKANWLFDAVFRKEAARSLAEKQSRVQRWIRLAMLVWRYPAIIIAPEFRRRARGALSFWN
jgi:GT2 family glycosyltransferase